MQPELVASLLVACLLPDMIGQPIEIAVQLRPFATVEPSVGAECTFPCLDVGELAIQTSCFPIGDPAIVASLLYPRVDARLAFVDVRGPVTSACQTPTDVVDGPQR